MKREASFLVLEWSLICWQKVKYLASDHGVRGDKSLKRRHIHLCIWCCCISFPLTPGSGALLFFFFTIVCLETNFLVANMNLCSYFASDCSGCFPSAPGFMDACYTPTYPAGDGNMCFLPNDMSMTTPPPNPATPLNPVGEWTRVYVSACSSFLTCGY